MASSQEEAENSNQGNTVTIVVKPFEKDGKRRSNVWEYFGHKFINDVKADDLVYCVECHKEGKYTTAWKKDSSTGTLSTHLKNFHNLNVSGSEASTAKRVQHVFTPSSSAVTPTEAKTIFARRLVLWLCEDMLPFSTVSGNGFAKFMIRMGYVKNASEIPSNVAVSQTALDDIYAMTREAFIEKAQKAPKVINVVTDLWTSLGKQPFITITVRFMNEDLNLENLTLSTEALEHPHTGEIIAKAIQENLDDAGLGNKILTVVADNAKNMNRLGPHALKQGVKKIPREALLKNCKKVIRCKLHSTHLIFSSDAPKDPRFKPVINILAKIKRIHGAIVYKANELKEEFERQQQGDLIEYMTECEEMANELLLDEQLPEFGAEEYVEAIQAAYQECIGGFEIHTRFEQMNVTRWTSAQNMVVSFIKNFKAIDAILKKMNTRASLSLVMDASEERTAVELKRLFEVFSETYKILQRGKSFNAIYYLPIVYKVRERLQAGADDDECSIRDCFKLILELYDGRVTNQIPKEFMAATSLDPDQTYSQHNKNAHEKSRTTIQEVLKDMVIKYQINMTENAQPRRVEGNQSLSLEKRNKLEFLGLITQPQDSQNIPQHLDVNQEISTYLQTIVGYDPQNDETFDFWKRNQVKFPILFQLVQALFPIPASSADAERSFSVAGAQLRCKRAKMNPHRAHKALFIHDNVHILDEKMKH